MKQAQDNTFLSLFMKNILKKPTGYRELIKGRTKCKREIEIREPPVPTESAQEQLDKLIGLADVKREVKKLTNMALLQKKRVEAGKKIASSSMHLVFTGNPGTGKTTVARLLGKKLSEIGLLKKGHLIETDRAKLVGEYVGHTEKKVKDAVEQAMDGVLFIDEAYSLAGGERDFGSIAIDTLIKLMEDNRDNLAVIVAGYTMPMKRFVAQNVGLQSRFTRYVTFEDYSASELYDIFDLMIKSCEYKLNNEAIDKAKKILYNHWLTRDYHFGNGRDVRTFFERAIELQAGRLIDSNEYDDLDTITENDIPDHLVLNITDTH